MSDDAKKILGYVIAGLGSLGGLAVVAMAAQWWISNEVDSQLASNGIISTADYERLETRIDGLEKLHEKDTVRVERKAEDIARILMEE